MKNNNLSLFSDNVISLMREEIHKANGNEVFFVGKKKANCINEILPIAWGNENEVPIIYDEAFRGDYVIHNHPRGNLTPSSNDL
ncbi:MAG: hypothetical protein OEV44_05145, partial [Spirochaetota bacterium]|nr:hypothetical protein [Spirochaetota bacterium]